MLQKNPNYYMDLTGLDNGPSKYDPVPEDLIGESIQRWLWPCPSLPES